VNKHKYLAILSTICSFRDLFYTLFRLWSSGLLCH